MKMNDRNCTFINSNLPVLMFFMHQERKIRAAVTWNTAILQGSTAPCVKGVNMIKNVYDTYFCFLVSKSVLAAVRNQSFLQINVW